MDGDQITNLLYLVLLGSAIVAGLFVQSRHNLGKTLQHLVVWALLFIGVVAVYGLWQDISNTVLPKQMVFEDQGQIELPRAPDGHYYVTLEINGAPTLFVVDTGASSMVLTRDAAKKAGIEDADLHFLTEAMTANGMVRTARVVLEDVELGPYTDRRVAAYVNAGEMENSLLGMSYLDRFSKLEISGGRLVLHR